ncbi:hypothetical protein LN42_06075 [Marinitoga sp. 1137]|uniref:hypothetical protein n=1 Tax=Marinitoga sp. 1137 TaxID=1545835 RepID=UPI0009503C29|nr:hypothetical protein [Marinitoga sp. 1137]APT75992.1 hypothetical protein LN42_06075 [Marinitoga sp. 1137]
MKRMLLITFLVFNLVIFAGSFSYSLGIELSGAILPFVGVSYNNESYNVGATLGFVFGPDEKNPEQLDYIFAPTIEAGYSLPYNFTIEANLKALVVVPYHFEQLYLMGGGIKYKIPINNQSFNLGVYGEFILPLSAGKRAWEKGMGIIPVPFIKSEYEF